MVGRTQALSLFFALSLNVSREDVALPLLQPFATACKAPLQSKSGDEQPSKYSGAGLAARWKLTTLARRVPPGNATATRSRARSHLVVILALRSQNNKTK